MNDLDMCYEIAKLRGVDFHIAMEDKPDAYLWCDDTESEYNPITDLALNCMLRDKHRVEVNYTYDAVDIFTGLSHTNVGFESKEDIPRAVCLCILKSQGLYHE